MKIPLLAHGPLLLLRRAVSLGLNTSQANSPVTQQQQVKTEAQLDFNSNLIPI